MLAMAEHFLEEQLRRIREMSKQMSRARDSAAELSLEFERHRAIIRQSPLHAVRDLRSYSSNDPAPDHAEHHAGRQPHRHTSRSRRK
jgi:hypothetical protein